jgi:hypothetical protein
MPDLYHWGPFSRIVAISFPGKTGPQPPIGSYDIDYTFSGNGFAGASDVFGGLFSLADMTHNSVQPINRQDTLITLDNVIGGVVFYVWSDLTNWVGTAAAFYPAMGQFVGTWGSFVANGYNSAGKPAVVRSPISPILNNDDFTPTSPALITPAFVANENNFVNGNVWTLFSAGNKPPIAPVGWFLNSIIQIGINFTTLTGQTTFSGTEVVQVLPGS